jgi:hypothetical protein
MEKYIVFQNGNDYKKYDFEVVENDFIFSVSFLYSNDHLRFYNSDTTKIVIEGGINKTHLELVTEFSKKLEEFKNGYLLG